MKKTLKISGIVVFALIILFTIIGSFIAIQSRPISGQNTAHISEITRDLLSLKKQVDSNTNQIYKLSKSHDKLQKITWAHGAKVNCVVKAVFETAYGKSS
jgi:peptidoglycan hydrolase CwlO-like protein